MTLPLATDWAATISSLATGAGTLVLAIATFASVRSANRSARVAEEALLEQRRPVLAQSRFDDPLQKIMFVERKWVRAEGGRGVAEHENDNVYLAMSLRNVGAGIGVCQAWAVAGGDISTARRPQHLPDSEFRAQTRDLYIPAGDLGMWQGALRDPDEPAYADVVAAIDAQEPVLIELLYSDQVGEQRTITRFAVAPYTNPDTNQVSWTVSTVRHWFLDRQGPRSETDIEERAAQIMRRIEAAALDGSADEAQATASDGDALGAPPGDADAVEILGSNGTEQREETESSEPREPDREREPEPVSVITRPNCE